MTRRLAQFRNLAPHLAKYFQRYYQFQNDEVQFENDLLRQIGSTVAVRFAEGWAIYLRYVILRSSGKSKEQVIADGNFLNCDITWEDSERVYGQLLQNATIRKRFVDTFAQYKGFVAETDQLKLIN